MTTVDPGYASWLKTDARNSVAEVASAHDMWGDTALDSRVISPLAFKTDADNESVRQAQFWAGPLARDRHIVAGFWASLIGQVITITGDRMGYENGADVLVIDVDETARLGCSQLLVLKRL